MTTVSEQFNKINEAIRCEQRDIWTRAAIGRVEAHRSGAVCSTTTERLTAEARIRLGERVLDVACGIGDPSIHIARMVGRLGEVLAVDICPAMVDIAQAAALECRLTNVRFQAIDNETELPCEAHSYDAVTCRFGLMFMPDPLAALIAWRNVLKPAGRIALCTHAALPSFQTTMEIVENLAPSAAKALNWRGALSLSSASHLSDLLATAGFEGVEVSCELQSHISGATVSECWDNMVRRSPLRGELETLPGTICDSIRDTCIAALTRETTNAPLTELFGGAVLFATGRNPYVA